MCSWLLLEKVLAKPYLSKLFSEENRIFGLIFISGSDMKTSLRVFLLGKFSFLFSVSSLVELCPIKISAESVVLSWNFISSILCKKCELLNFLNLSLQKLKVLAPINVVSIGSLLKPFSDLISIIPEFRIIDDGEEHDGETEEGNDTFEESRMDA